MCQFAMAGNGNGNGNDNSDEKNAVPMEDLSWRVAKLRLEESNTRRFLKSKPIKLPYDQSSKWIRYNYSPKTKEEFKRLFADGELKNVYISKQPK